MKTVTPSLFKEEVFAQRNPDSNKGDYGRALLACGSFGMAGASVLACSAALRCGIGICENFIDQSIYNICAVKNPEAIFTIYNNEKEAISLFKKRLKLSDACLVGCGSANNDLTAKIVEYALENSKKPVVVDADGINCIAGHIDVLRKHSCTVVLTPHPGEMARLVKVTVKKLQANREKYAGQLAREYGVFVVLKGQNTVIACPNGENLININGNAGMATGGSGDVLAGMVTAFLARGIDPRIAVCTAVYLHGVAGDDAAKRLSQTYMLPRDIIESLSGVFLNLEK